MTGRCPICRRTPEEANGEECSFASVDESRVSALRVDIYVPQANLIAGKARPKNITRSAWIPHTLGDQIWVLYEFATEADRLQWEASLTDPVKGWLDRDIIKPALHFGWETRDPNGFRIPERARAWADAV